MKKLVRVGLMLTLLLASLVLASPAAAALAAGTNINTIDVSTNLNFGASGCAADYPQSPAADVSTWRVAASVSGLGSGVQMLSSNQPTRLRCYNSSNAGWLSDGRHVWLTCYTFDTYYGGTGEMWVGVVEYGPSNVAYATFLLAGWQTARNIAAQVPACSVGPGGIVSPAG